MATEDDEREYVRKLTGGEVGQRQEGGWYPSEFLPIGIDPGPATESVLWPQTPSNLRSAIEAACRMTQKAELFQTADRKFRQVSGRKASQDRRLETDRSAKQGDFLLEAHTASTMALIAVEGAVQASYYRTVQDATPGRTFYDLVKAVNEAGSELPTELLKACRQYRNILAHAEPAVETTVFGAPTSGIRITSLCGEGLSVTHVNRPVIERRVHKPERPGVNEAPNVPEGEGGNGASKAADYSVLLSMLGRHRADPQPCFHDAWKLVDLAVAVASHLDAVFGSHTHVEWTWRGARYEWMAADPAAGCAVTKKPLIGLEDFRLWVRSLLPEGDADACSFGWPPLDS